ncbi:uncharacterized protein LOC129740587 [Uranotaenia lowii]|uniref:uncharacterized protein LOC129740587 n=1 Tax=Uranotaenia lowii TaxID=190385 RepID=UPI00247B2B3B|nr:uncharacterized protein LOC129740587 [Uranotaenia lowii]
MKAVTLVLCTLVVTIAARCVRDNGNGEPGCKLQEEISQKYWRHHHDPTAYWECVSMNRPAEQRRCGSELAFHAGLLECVPWDEWEWEPPCAPPSRPEA